MKPGRKLTSLLLALVMVFALAVTVAADGTTGTTGTGSITVENPIEGQNYTAYKIFDVVYDEAKENYSYTIKDTSEWYNTVSAYTTGLTLNKVGDTTSNTYVVTTTDAFSPAAFADALKKALDADSTAFHGKELTKSGSPAKASVTVDELGYYFVTSTNGALCNLTTTNPHITIHDKNDMPFEKTAQETSVEVGQIVHYTIKGKVPDHTWFDEYTYEITDKMSKGLTFDNTSVKVTVGDAEVPSTDNKYTLAEGSSTDEYTFKLSIDVKQFKIGDEIVVKYNATVNENAVAQISKNKAVLRYSNDPTDSTKTNTTPEQEVPVYTSKIAIVKVETGNENKKLPDAKFVLYKKAPTETDPNAIQYYKKWADTDTTKAVSWVGSITEATEVTTDKDGAASFEGLADGTYYLVETKAPAGYNQLDKPVKVEVHDGENNAPVTNKNQLTVTATVKNQAGTLLPSTGGMGTTVFYVLGAVLVVGAGVLLVTKKRMSQGEV